MNEKQLAYRAKIMAQSSFGRAWEMSVFAYLLFGISAGMLYVWPDTHKTPFILIILGTLFLFFSEPFLSLQGWKMRLYYLVEASVFFAAVLLSNFFVPYEKNLYIWGIGGALFYFALTWMLASKLKSSEIWANEWHKPIPQQRQMQMAQNQSNDNNQQQVASASQEFPARRPRFTYKDVHGMEELKANLSDTVANFREDGGNGIMLSGDPGNGKTFVTEAFAGQLGLNFLEAGTSELTSKWIGDTTEKITRLFEAAREQAPCVLFLDEIDSFLLDRGGDGMNQDQRQSANTLLTAVADLNKGLNEHGVLIMAATNFLDKLDAAGIREGRFDKKIQIQSPDFEARVGILLDGLAGYKVEKETVNRVVARWEGFSVVRMRQIAKTAKTLARDKGGYNIDIELLSQALREVQGHAGAAISKSSLRLSNLAFTADQKMKLNNIVDQINRRHSIEARGGKIPKGAIFFGPAGAGKTTVAKALALEVNWAYLPTTGQALLHSPEEIDKIIAKASDLRPTIVFIDEAEGVMADRQLSPQTKEIVNKLLAVMDGEKPLHDVFFIAATNHPEEVDPAMIRWGRFSEQIDFTPDDSVVASVINNFIEARKESVEFEGDLDGMIERMIALDYTAADIEGCLLRSVNQALISATDEEKKVQVNVDVLP